MDSLVVDKLSINFDGIRALHNISLRIADGERRVIIGPNGAGKTTLFNAISGNIKSVSGSISVFGRDVTKLSTYKRAKMGLARTFQITNLFSGLTVRENIAIALLSRGNSSFHIIRPMSSRRDVARTADGLLERWNFAEIAHRKVSQISYGEKRQLDLLLAMATRPKIILLDEPMAGLSEVEVVRVASMIRELPRTITLVMIEHDMNVVFSIADQITVLNQGTMLAEGSVAEIRANDEVTSIYLGTEDEE